MHTQRKIKELLLVRQWTASDLAKHFGCTQQAIRYHLNQVGAKCVRVDDANGQGRKARVYWLE